jgi:hypothetical protein
VQRSRLAEDMYPTRPDPTKTMHRWELLSSATDKLVFLYIDRSVTCLVPIILAATHVF